MKTFVRLSMMRDRDAILEHKNQIDGLVINAHIIETYQKASSSYIVSNQFPYIIDPVTYRFPLDTIEEHVSKKWFNRLIDFYGVENLLLNDGRISINELKNKNNLARFTECVINYQENRISELSGDTIQLMNWFEGEIKQPNKPYCVIPPYFIIQSNSELEINLQAINFAFDNNSLPIYAMVALDYDILFDSVFLEDILNAYSRTSANGFFIWVTDFNEVREKGVILKLYRNCFANFKEKIGDKELLNMYGGYFSTILSAINTIDGLVHGVGASESKNPYTSGGPAPTRYYIPILHRMLSLESATDLLEEQDFRCACPICSENVISEMNIEKLIRHALNAKIIEKDEIASMSLEEIIRKLRNDYTAITSVSRQDLQRRFSNAGDHLSEWIKALES